MNREATNALIRAICQVVSPPPDLTVSQWADTYRMLSPEAAAAPGKWSTDTTPYMREIMDSVTDPDYETIVIMSSSQIGKALALDTPLFSTKGWITMGGVAVGDVLFDESLKPATVTFVTPVMYDRACFEVCFSDGGKITADLDHQWAVQGKGVVTTGVLRVGDRLPSTPWDAVGVTVTAINAVESVPVRCITVDSPNHLYLAGKTLIPTHNTELVLNIIGYFIHYDPAPMLVIQPNVEPMAKDFAKDRLSTMIRDTPVLRERVRSQKDTTSGSTMLHRTYPGGHVTIVGANSPSGLASRPIRVVLADEVDRYPLSAGEEGDPLTLVGKRTTTFWNRKKIYVSTPTTKGESRIEAAYMEGTQEEWCYPCPSCGTYQPFKWEQIRFEDATHECCKCKERFDEFAWKRGNGDWYANEPEAKKVRSFHINELSSPWKRWTTIIEEFLEAKHGGVERLKAWVNTSLGETWEEQADSLDSESLMKRREAYNCDIPEGALVITAAVDVQDDRLECEAVGWGIGMESWGLQYRTFVGDPAVLKSGDPSAPSVWEQLDKWLMEPFSYADGSQLHITCTCIDSGGHFTSEVYEFCVQREHRRVFAIKGQGGEGVPLLGKPTRNNRKRAALFSIGVNTAKEQLFSRLKTEYVGPGYCHYPIEVEKGYDEGYFKGLVAEKRRTRWVKGRPKIEWFKASGARNEPIDLRNYATAALEILNPDFEILAQIPRERVVSVQNKTIEAAKTEIIQAVGVRRKPKGRRVLSGGVG